MHPARITATGALLLSALSACSADAPTVARPKAVAAVANDIAPPASCPTVAPYRPLLDLASRLRAHVTIERVGHPTWRPVDFHVLSAPIGTAADDYAEEAATLTGLFPPPNHLLHPQLGVGPGAPHCPPYDREVTMGERSAGFAESNPFTPAQFAAPAKGIWVWFMLVPTPGTMGSSPDFQNGPIMANSLFPIEFSFATYRNGSVFDPGFTYEGVALNDQSLTPSFAVDGASHMQMGLGESDEFAPAGLTDMTGRYEQRMQVLDSGGNGWKIVAKWVIKAATSGR